MGARPPSPRARVSGFARAGRRRFLAAFLAAEAAVLAFMLAQRAWPRDVPEAFGWTIYLGSYPWSLPWIGAEDPAATLAIAAAFALNVAIVATAAAWAWRRYRMRGVGT